MHNEEEHVITHDIGCQPGLTESGEVVVQSDRSCFLVFVASTSTPSESGFYEDLGTVAVEVLNCDLTRYGYPNDEGLLEHPLYSKGLDECGGVGEVLNSNWKAMLEAQMNAAVWRIRGEAGRSKDELRHFIITFKENVFECLAEGLVVISLGRSFKETLDEVNRRILES